MGNNLCCEEDISTKQGNKDMKKLMSHKEQLNFEDPENMPQQKIEQIMRHTVVIEGKDKRLEDFDKISLLGEGGFAMVFLVDLKENKAKGIDKKYAMKQIPKKKLYERRVVENLMIEKKVLAEIKSNFIIALNFAFQDRQNCYFVMEYASGGDVYSFLVNPKQPGKVADYKRKGEDAPRFILATVILAMECLHQKKIMYRDLKPQNVLVFEDGYSKLADFGLAKKNQNDELSRTMAGTKIYFAPEIIQKKMHNRTVDFWTLGVFLHELLLFVPPFDPSAVMKGKYMRLCQAAEQNRDWKGAAISDQAKDMINAFLKVEPNDRLGVKTFDDIKNHAFFKNFDWAKLERMEMQSPLKEIVKKYPIKFKEVPQERQAKADGGQFPSIQDLTYAEPKIM